SRERERHTTTSRASGPGERRARGPAARQHAGSVRGGVHPAFSFARQDQRVMRVLVVDDEPAVREALERILRLDGYEVELASNGKDAIRRLSSAPADAVLLDVLMPELDGLEVCRRLRDTGDRTPVLMLTARDAVGE